MLEAQFSSYLTQKDKMDVVHSNEENQTVLNGGSKAADEPSGGTETG